MKALLLSLTILLLPPVPARAETGFCERFLGTAKKKLVDKTLDAMAIFKGLPKYLKINAELRQSGRYLKYDNFGEMGLAEMGISVRYNKTYLDGLNTGRPLIIVANHHLGIADGLTMQYLSSRSRRESPSLLYLARWIEKLLPHAIFGDEKNWGTAIPVDINLPKESDPEYEAKLNEVNKFNSHWSRSSIKVLRKGGALIVFPAGHVASMNQGAKYPENIYDAPHSWQAGFLDLARMGKADIAFADVHSVNSESFYKDRKRFGGGDKERIIWFFSEALAKKNKAIDVYLSKPLSLAETYAVLAETFSYSVDALKADPKLTAELMRQYTYKVSELHPQVLDSKDSPQIRP